MDEIKEFKILYNLGENFASGTSFNYLAKCDSIYVIDNHLAAFWCWSRLPQHESYKLIHIDQHLDANQAYYGTEDIIKSIDWKNLPIGELTNIMSNDSDSKQILFWDNYICCYRMLNPNFFETIYFYTHGVGDFDYEGKHVRLNYEKVFDLTFDNDSKYILSLDLDVFFRNDFERKEYGLFQILEFAKWLNLNKHRFTQIIICLSPDLCKGWKNSKRIAEIILNELKYKL